MGRPLGVRPLPVRVLFSPRCRLVDVVVAKTLQRREAIHQRVIEQTHSGIRDKRMLRTVAPALQLRSRIRRGERFVLVPYIQVKTRRNPRCGGGARADRAVRVRFRSGMTILQAPRHTESVRLLSRDGGSIELRPLAYQFDVHPAPEQGTDWDANWLVIFGEVRTVEGLGWNFVDPCLTTWNTGMVSEWLRGTVDGTVLPTPAWSDDWPVDPHFRHFTEPNVAFSLAERTPSRIRLRIHLSLEALPPSLRGDDRPELFAYFVNIDTDADSVSAAADVWDLECQAFAVR